MIRWRKATSEIDGESDLLLNILFFRLNSFPLFCTERNIDGEGSNQQFFMFHERSENSLLSHPQNLPIDGCELKKKERERGEVQSFSNSIVYLKKSETEMKRLSLTQ